jgi:uncharacterized protein (DUF433 family)
MTTVVNLSTTEVAALVDVDEGRIRKDVEYGLFGKASPPRFSLADAVYFRAIQVLGIQLGVDDRTRLHDTIGLAMKAIRPPEKVELGPVLELKIRQLVDEVRDRLERFEAWEKKRVVRDPAILGGEPTFPESRLGVRHVGGMLLKGASKDEILEDYPYLKPEDLEFAPVFTRAYPRMGRPR